MAAASPELLALFREGVAKAGLKQCVDLKGERAKACCPLHEDDSPSLSINYARGLWNCFGCGAGGGVVAWYRDVLKQPMPGRVANGGKSARSAKSQNNPAPKAGKLKSQIKGRKPDGLDDCGAVGPWLVVPSQKARTRIAGLLGTDGRVVSPYRGAASWSLNDWEALRGEPVFLLADEADAADFQELGEHLVKFVASSVHLVVLPAGLGWDTGTAPSADAVVDTIQRFRAPLRDPREDAETLKDNRHFRVVGRGEGVIYVRRKRTHEILTLRPAGISTNTLITLAPLDWWLGLGEGTAKAITRDFLQVIVDALLRAAEDAGRWRTNRVRGLGATIDGFSVALHLGDCVWLAGKRVELDDPSLQYLYPEFNPLPHPGEPATTEELRDVADAIAAYPWNSEIDGLVFLGWLGSCIGAGALDWRPHAQISGTPSGGKSWILINAAEPIIGPFGHFIIGGTGPAMRRTIQSHALPVIYDEAEPGAGEGSITEIYRLMRAASDGAFGYIVADRASGDGVVRTNPRCAFLLSAITTAGGMADESRRTSIGLGRNKVSTVDFMEIADRIHGALSKDKAERVRSYLLRAIPSLVQRVGWISQHLGEQDLNSRDAAQLAGIIGGLSLWYHTAPARLTAEQIVELSDPFLVVPDDQQKNDEPDWRRVILAILNTEIRIDDPEGMRSPSITRPMRELENAHDRGLLQLRGYGIAADLYAGTICFAQAHPFVVAATRKAMGAAVNVGRLLMQTPGAQAVQPMRFGGMRSRAVRVTCEAVDLQFDPPNIL